MDLGHSGLLAICFFYIDPGTSPIGWRLWRLPAEALVKDERDLEWGGKGNTKTDNYLTNVWYIMDEDE